MKRSKRYQEVKKLAPTEPLEMPAAIERALQTAKAKFDEAVELHAKLGVDLSKPEQAVRISTPLPHGTGRTLVVAAFVPENLQKEAKDAGATVVGGEELIEQIKQTNKIPFAQAVAHPSMMPKLAQIAKILGPKGLMPSPKTETVGPDVAAMVKGLVSGKINVKMDETGNIHASFGKVSFGLEKLQENLTMLLDAIKKAQPKGVKGAYIKSLTIKTTMGPAIPLK